ncbi:protein croquemort-like [Macrobrachium nipponense]|uniref:protein croquemort-like n=1 Tax=Macrobrachium nipponense TaxID=159736 RepID=UPI0030C85C60
MNGSGQPAGLGNGGFHNSQEVTANPEVCLSASSLQNNQSYQQQNFTQPFSQPMKPRRKRVMPSSLLTTSGCNKLSGCQYCLLVSSILTIIFSVAMLAGGFKLIFDAIMKTQMEVREGSKSFEMWKTTPFPLILNLFLWNITNHEAFLEGAKPVLKECGPYVWREYHDKQGIEFHHNATVTYLQQRWWIWDAALSGRNSLDDFVYAMNPIPLSAAWSVKHYPKWMQHFAFSSLNVLFKEHAEQAVVKSTVGELVFTGFEDPVLDWIQKEIIAEDGKLHRWLPFLNLPPGLSDYDRFGWFYMRNMSLYYDGIFNMMTGTDDLKNIGKIDMWNYTRETTFFESPCNSVAGSAGEFFQPDLQRDKIEFYSSDLCMVMKLYYQGDVDHSGLKAYRFWGSNHTFANGSVVPGNECYCVKGTCGPTGLLNAESCRMGSPAFISFPHYFNADPFLLDQIEGLSPDEDKHAFIMDIMPETGSPVNVNARMQINMRVIPYKGKIDILANVPDIYLPMVWFEELAEVPEDMVGQLKALQVITSTPVMPISFSVLLLLGVGTLAYIVFVCLRKRNLSTV